MKQAWLWLLAVVVVVVFGLGLYFFSTLGDSIDGAYAQWGAADIVIDYMEQNGGRWPRSWDDLHPMFDKYNGHVGGWSFEKFCNRIRIDWNADPAALRAAALAHPEPTFDVIGTNAWGDAKFEGHEPNRILHSYFRSTPAQNSPAPMAHSNDPAKQPTLDELLLFFPAKFPAGNWQPADLKFEDANFNAADGTKLHGWYCPSEKPRAVVLFAHGNAGNLTHRANALRRWQSELQTTIMIFDYRGYGRSEGTPSVEGILQDARAARTFLAKRAGVTESQIVLAGESLGGAVAIDLAAKAGARGLVLQNTFSSLKDVAMVHYPKLAFLVPPAKLDSASLIGNFKGPLMQCHGDADRTIPFELGEKLFKAGNEPKQFVRNGGNDHNDRLPESYWHELDQFLNKLPK
jgi:uncharacterized protein